MLFLIPGTSTSDFALKGDEDACSSAIATLCIAGILFKLFSLLAACLAVSLLDWLGEGRIFTVLQI
jgi:hypothetical protein